MTLRRTLCLLLALCTVFLTAACSKVPEETESLAQTEEYAPTVTLSDEERAALNKAQADAFAADFFAGKYNDTRLYAYEDLTPYVTLGDDTDLSFPENEEIRKEPDEAEIEKYLRMIQLQTMVTDSDYTSLTEGEVAMWDAVLVDYKGEENGVEMENATAEDQTILIGSGNLIPGFEEGLIGHAIGEEVKLNLTFPLYYHDAMYAGKAATFTVKIKSLKRPTLPEYDLAKFNEIMEKSFSSMDEVREEIRERLTVSLTAEREAKIMDYLFRKILKKSSFTLPEKEVENRKKYYLDYYSQYLGEGEKLEDKCEEMFGISYEALLDAADTASTNTVKTELCILALAKKWEIAPTEEQLSAYVLGAYENGGSQYYTNVETYVTVSVGYEGADYFYLQLLNQMLLQEIYDQATAA